MNTMIYLFVLLLMAPSDIGAGSTGSVHVVVKGLRNSNGWVVCHIFNSEDGYPTNSKKAMKYINDFDLDDMQAEFLFAGLKPGKYAFTVHHDENGNKKMDKTFLGLPSEGWACSNNAKAFLGMGIPDFDDACFEVKDKQVEQVIKINY